jgi:hypothetical protein
MPQGHGAVRITKLGQLLFFAQRHGKGKFGIIRFMREKQVENEDLVKLKPINGVRPGVYLTVIYSIILILVIFLLLFLPGIRKPGAVLVVKTEPQGAAIRVDGLYMGTAADRIFVPKGKRRIQAVLPGFESYVTVYDIPGRVFGSLLFPKRFKVEFFLLPLASSPAGVFAEAASDYAAWTFAGEPTATWQVPLSLSEGAYRIGQNSDAANYEALNAAAGFAVTRAAMRDLVRAKMLLDNGGLSPSPVTLAGSVSDILVFLSDNPGSAAWLADLLPPESAAVVKSSNWKNNNFSLISDAAALSARPLDWQRRFELAGLSFFGSSALLVSENTVPRALFESFLNENPQYRDEDSDIFPVTGNTGASWDAAEAFCQWLSGRLPTSMADMEVRLPTEDEWALASQRIGNMGASWEWCADPFVPLQFVNVSGKAKNAVGSPERTLLRAAASGENRTSLPPDFFSPMVSFRPVIAAKSHE